MGIALVATIKVLMWDIVVTLLTIATVRDVPITEMSQNGEKKVKNHF